MGSDRGTIRSGSDFLTRGRCVGIPTTGNNGCQVYVHALQRNHMQLVNAHAVINRGPKRFIRQALNEANVVVLKSTNLIAVYSGAKASWIRPFPALNTNAHSKSFIPYCSIYFYPVILILDGDHARSLRCHHCRRWHTRSLRGAYLSDHRPVAFSTQSR
jgi:hypothetical protein